MMMELFMEVCKELRYCIFCNILPPVFDLFCYFSKIHYLEKDVEGVVNFIGGVETPVYEHVWEFSKTLSIIEDVNPTLVTQSKESPLCLFSLKNSIPSIRKAIYDLGHEYHATTILPEIIPNSNKLMIAIILHVFRNNLNLWNYKSVATLENANIELPPVVNVLNLAESYQINPFYHRLFLLLLSYLNETGYVVLRPVDGNEELTTLDLAEVSPTTKYFRIVETNKSNDLSINSYDEEDAYSLVADNLMKWPQTRQSMVLMMDVGMRLDEVRENNDFIIFFPLIPGDCSKGGCCRSSFTYFR
jgi:hypothetical protein